MCNTGNDDMLVCVDALDRETGIASKLACHSDGGRLHRAFSVFLWRPGTDGMPQLLLQRRAEGKYHSGGLWTNSCCSHPRVGESLNQAVERRLAEELGVHGVDCREIASFVYRAEFDNGMTEFEFDHVYVGRYEAEVALNPLEADASRWVDVEDVVRDLGACPQRYTAWFVTAAPLVAAHLLDGIRK